MKEAAKTAGVLTAGGALGAGAATAAGFTSAGPVAGSLAAAWQAIMGSVAAGSPFAITQSVTMTPILGVAMGPALAGAGIAAVGYGGYRLWNRD